MGASRTSRGDGGHAPTHGSRSGNDDSSDSYGPATPTPHPFPDQFFSTDQATRFRAELVASRLLKQLPTRRQSARDRILDCARGSTSSGLSERSVILKMRFIKPLIGSCVIREAGVHASIG